MTVDQLRKCLHAVPFRPFVIYMADGRRLRVEHPEFVAISPTGRTAQVYANGEDAATCVDLLLVTALKVEGPKARLPRRS